jgi:hypothetical protein
LLPVISTFALSSSPPFFFQRYSIYYPIRHNIMPSPTTATPSTSTSSHNVVGVHYKVGKKIGEGSFGVIYEGKNKQVGGMLFSTHRLFSSRHTTHL